MDEVFRVVSLGVLAGMVAAVESRFDPVRTSARYFFAHRHQVIQGLLSIGSEVTWCSLWATGPPALCDQFADLDGRDIGIVLEILDILEDLIAANIFFDLSQFVLDQL